MTKIRGIGLKIISEAIVFRLYFNFSSVLIAIALSRYLGVENFGRYAWLISIVFLLAGLAQAGGSSLVVRETSRSSGRQVPALLLRRTAMISGGTLVVMTGVAALINRDRISVDLLVPLGLLAVGYLALVLVSSSNRGIGLLQAGQVPEMLVQPTLFLALIGGAMLLRPNFGPVIMIYLLVAAYALAGLVATLHLVRGLATRPMLPEEAPDTDWLGSFFRLGLIGWLVVGNAQLLIFLTGLLADYTQVGLYRIAMQAVVIMGLGLSAIETVQAPAYARAWKDGNVRLLHDLLQQSCRFGVAMSAVVMVFLFIFGQSLLSMLFDESFTAAFPALCILACGQLFNALTGNVGLLLIAARQEKKLIYGNFLALAVTLLMAWLFIPQYGALAAAAASGLGMIVRNFLALWFCHRTLGLLSLPFAPFWPQPDTITRANHQEIPCPTSPPMPFKD